MEDITTQLLAIWGAFLSTILAIIKMLEFNRDKVHLIVKVRSGYKVFPSNTIYGDKTYVDISVSNRGRRTITVSQVAIIMPKHYALATDSFIKGQRELSEGKNTSYLMVEEDFEKEGMLPRDYVAVASDATGRQYYSHILPVRWFKIIRMRLYAKKKKSE